jgi:hypothetical protein
METVITQLAALQHSGLCTTVAIQSVNCKPTFYIKTIILSRQARDKHRESTQKRLLFSLGPSTTTLSAEWLQVILN